MGLCNLYAQNYLKKKKIKSKKDSFLTQIFQINVHNVSKPKYQKSPKKRSVEAKFFYNDTFGSLLSISGPTSYQVRFKPFKIMFHHCAIKKVILIFSVSNLTYIRVIVTRWTYKILYYS